MWAHGLPRSKLVDLLRKSGDFKPPACAPLVTEVMREEFGAEPLGSAPQYKVALYTAGEDGELRPVNREGEPFPSGTKETRRRSGGGWRAIVVALNCIAMH